CPTGITTQDPLRQRALVVEDRAQRVANYHRHTLEALAELTAAAGVSHPCRIGKEFLMRRLETGEVSSFAELLPDLEPGVLLRPGAAATLPEPFRAYWDAARPDRWRLS
ncbi:MAG: FMN-binding glutamate synthase family protein, partial [Betaproteobacteria bacterium]|nr:FMN-binding glutamate synthase family protein [Betaproteobacteria bacterium]